MIFFKVELILSHATFFRIAGSHQSNQQVYFPFPPSSTGAYARTQAHHPNLYAQGIMYVPAAGASPATVPGDASTSMTMSLGDDGSRDPKRAEKENMKFA
jgi:hypothetical protein